MQSLGILLVIIQLLTGQISDTQSHLLGLFNILSKDYSVHNLAFSLNSIIGPIQKPNAQELELNSRAAIIIDNDSGKILYNKSADDRLRVASITKLMTALVALDNLQGNLDRVITVPAVGAAEGGSSMDLTTGEKLTAHDLLRGLLIASANDAAVTFANTTSATPELFIQQMNTKAATLGLRDTHFVNPTGFDAPNHYSTAEDIAKLAQYALKDPIISAIVATPKLTIASLNTNQKHNLANTNQLVGQYDNIIGVKTGTTGEAGPSLVVAAKGTANQKVIVVLLDSPDRFGEGKRALDWAFSNFSWIEPL
ncbi:MAG: D-alanyl-D-alanine carboxypeptidase family protein [Patescibacteria group bacterium]